MFAVRYVSTSRSPLLLNRSIYGSLLLLNRSMYGSLLLLNRSIDGSLLLLNRSIYVSLLTRGAFLIGMRYGMGWLLMWPKTPDPKPQTLNPKPVPTD